MNGSPANINPLGSTEYGPIAAWLDVPAPRHAAEEIPALLGHLATLRASRSPSIQRNATLARLYERIILITQALLPTLTECPLPIPVPRKTRPLIRHLQELLGSLADGLRITPELAGTHTEIGEALYRRLRVLGQQLLISHLAGSPAMKDVWQQLHETYAAALHPGPTSASIDALRKPLQNAYFSAVLLGCAQPASFTSQEIGFVAEYLTGLVDEVDCCAPADVSDPALFWIESARDTPAMAWSRKPAPPETKISVFSCRQIVAVVKGQLARLEAGVAADALGLPVFAGSAAGRGVLRRLIQYWGEPGKRRFPRRHQNYRGVLCHGLDNLWRLFRSSSPALAETSNWMIINESPDGCAIRHLSGKTANLAVGEIAAIRRESDDRWQTGIVRWALSENQEHLELGLQILSAQAFSAVLAQPSKRDEPDCRPLQEVLLLPKIKDVRNTELLVAAAGTLAETPAPFILLIENDNLVVREAKKTRLSEQNGLIEVFAIEPAGRSM